jgi:DNA-binding CsgD family transcriptional regulator
MIEQLYDESGLPIASMAVAASPFPVPSDLNEAPDGALQEILALMYRAAGGEAGLWLEALGKLRAEFSGKAAQILQVDLPDRRPILHLLAIDTFDLISLDQYEEKGFQDPINGVFFSFPGRALSSDVHFDHQAMKSRIEIGYVPPDFSRFLTLCFPIGTIWCNVGVLRSRSDPPFTVEDCTRFGTMSGDFRRIHDTIKLRLALQNSPNAAIATLSAIDLPSALLQGSGEILAVNDAAQILLGTDVPIWADQETWRLAIQNAVRYGVATLPLDRGTIKFRRLSDVTADDQGLIRSYATTFVLVDFSGLEVNGAQNLERVASTFGLTQAETIVLQHLGQGLDVGAIARRRGNSVETIRSQMRALRAKTGKSRREELAALVG